MYIVIFAPKSIKRALDSFTIKGNYVKYSAVAINEIETYPPHRAPLIIVEYIYRPQGSPNIAFSKKHSYFGEKSIPLPG